MTDDVKRIAQNTGYSESDISQVKHFIFEATHELELGIFKRFDPSYEIAPLWQRLIDGKNIQKHDFTLLDYEIMEKNLMDMGFSQDEAHRMTSQKYNYAKEAIEYYGEDKKR